MHPESQIIRPMRDRAEEYYHLSARLYSMLQGVTQRLLESLSFSHERSYSLEVASQLGIDVLQDKPYACLFTCISVPNVRLSGT